MPKHSDKMLSASEALRLSRYLTDNRHKLPNTASELLRTTRRLLARPRLAISTVRRVAAELGVVLPNYAQNTGKGLGRPRKVTQADRQIAVLVRVAAIVEEVVDHIEATLVENAFDVPRDLTEAAAKLRRTVSELRSETAAEEVDTDAKAFAAAAGD